MEPDVGSLKAMARHVVKSHPTVEGSVLGAVKAFMTRLHLLRKEGKGPGLRHVKRSSLGKEKP